jgi:alpha-glucosidase (family GH31 glycosyl hydrolase)
MNESVYFEVLDEYVLHFKLFNKTGRRWEVPIYNQHSEDDYKKIPIKQMGLAFTGEPFGFELRDPSETVFASSMEYNDCTLNYTDKFIEFGLWFPAKRVFGLGERVTRDLELCDGNDKCMYTIFARDAPSPSDDGSKPGGKNMYGHQPFYLLQLFDGRFVGVLFLNSNAQDVAISKSSNFGLNVYHKTIGGIIDFYFFYPNTPEYVLQKYHSLIGKPYLSSFWTLGYHKARQGWTNLQAVKDAITKLENSDIPLDVICPMLTT